MHGSASDVDLLVSEGTSKTTLHKSELHLHATVRAMGSPGKESD